MFLLKKNPIYRALSQKGCKKGSQSGPAILLGLLIVVIFTYDFMRMGLLNLRLGVYVCVSGRDSKTAKQRESVHYGQTYAHVHPHKREREREREIEIERERDVYMYEYVYLYIYIHAYV